MPQQDVHPMEGYPPLLVGRCSLCLTQQVRVFTVAEDGYVLSSHLYINYLKGTYQLMFHIRAGYFAINQVSHPKFEIFRLNYIPDITPNNAISKLQTILTFL
jgi:hypothetical protein